MKKEGQVTIFIALGIIILVLVGLTYYFRGEIFKSEWEKQRELASSVPQKAEDVRNTVESCFEYTLNKGIEKLGLQGGYINLPEDPIPETPSNPFSNSLRIFPGQDLKVAYWYYRSANNIEKSLAPTLTMMEEELELYVTENILPCLGTTAILETYNLTIDQPLVEIDIQDDAVYLTSDYRIRLERDEFVFELQKFYAKSDVKLGRMHALAKEIIDRSSTDHFLEDKTIDMLVANDELPYSGTETSCNTEVWTDQKVKEDFTRIAAQNIPYIKVKNTDFDKTHDYFVWDVLDSRNSGLKTNFRFSEKWPLRMDIEPSEGGLLIAKPLLSDANEAVAFIRAFFCLKDYNFIYDIQYPVLITLTDESGFSFQFATQVIIDNNQPRKNLLGNLTFIEEQPRICQSGLTDTDVRTFVPDNTGYLVPLEGVDIKFKCVSTTCDMGTTRLGRDDEAALIKKFPQCVNALVTGKKNGFHPAKEFASTNVESEITLILEEYKELDYDIRIIEGALGRKPSSSETVIFQMTDSGQDYSTSAVYPSNDKKIRLIPGTYDVTAYIIEKNSLGIVIQGKEIEHCSKVPVDNLFGVLGFTEERCTQAEIPNMEVNEVVKGGVKFTWDINRQTLYNSDNVTFYIPPGTMPRSYDDITEVYEDIESIKSIVYPVFR